MISLLYWIVLYCTRNLQGVHHERNKSCAEYVAFFYYQMQECSNLLGIPVSHIFPVKNYHEEVDTVNDIDVLILKALEQIVNLANDALTDHTSGDNPE